MRPTRPTAPIVFLAAFAVLPVIGRVALGDAGGPATFHVAPGGNDAWTGTSALADPSRGAGPFATLARARDAARQARERAGGAGPIRVVVHAGRYELAEPLVFSPADSGTAERPTIFEAAPGETAVISGGRIVTGWGPHPGPRGEWVADLPALKDQWRFRHVAVDGQRRERPRLPAAGTYVMAGLAGADPKARYTTPANRFEYAPGQIDPSWRNLSDVEAVVLHYWVDSHLKIRQVDPVRRVVTLDRFARRKFTDDFKHTAARYFVANVYEALAPGQFYADHAAGRLHYRPRAGETRERSQVVAPRLTSLVRFQGEPRAGRFVEHLTLRGLTLSDTTHEPGPDDAVDLQAANSVPGALVAEGARHVALEGCRLVNLGGYAVEVRDGCRDVRLVGNEAADVGAGGFKIDGGNAQSPEPLRTSRIVVTDNRLHHLGREFHSGVGVLLMNGQGCTVAHNEISELFYTGVSVGWVWGYGPSVSRDNTIAFNHIHHVGKGLLSDMGGVYLLGVSPGTVVRNNRIHDIEAHGYGGWGLYTDEGSTGIVLEDNLVYRTTHGGFHQHYGRDNVVRNNVFALARDEQVARTRDEPHRSFTFERNIVYYRTGKLFGHNWSGGPERVGLDRNVYWNAAGATPEFPGGSLDAWRARGFDRHSVVADPRFVDPGRDDFRLMPDSPAPALGFKPLDLSSVGPRR